MEQWKKSVEWWNETKHDQTILNKMMKNSNQQTWNSSISKNNVERRRRYDIRTVQRIYNIQNTLNYKRRMQNKKNNGKYFHPIEKGPTISRLQLVFILKVNMNNDFFFLSSGFSQFTFSFSLIFECDNWMSRILYAWVSLLLLYFFLLFLFIFFLL